MPPARPGPEARAVTELVCPPPLVVFVVFFFKILKIFVGRGEFSWLVRMRHCNRSIIRTVHCRMHCFNQFYFMLKQQFFFGLAASGFFSFEVH